MKRVLLVLFSFTILFQFTLFAQSNIVFDIRSDFPQQNPWVKKLLVKSAKFLEENLASDSATIPRKVIVTIKKDPKSRGISGNANGYNNSINFKSSTWFQNKYTEWILVHELVNLLTSYYGSKAYPSDWWANGRSPFPIYITSIVLKELGYKKGAKWTRTLHMDQLDQQFFWKLDKKYGIDLFQRFFTLLQLDGVDLKKIGKRWPHPDKVRTAYALTYLSLAAGVNLAPVALKHNIGKKPSDWHKRHPKIPFYNYKVSSKNIQTLVYLREQLLYKNKGSKKDKDNFKKGILPHGFNLN